MHIWIPLVSCASIPMRNLEAALLDRPVSWEIHHDTLCEVNERAFTGFRILHERTLSMKSAKEHKKTIIMRCQNGLSVSHLVLPGNATVWNTEFELDPPQDVAEKIKIVRRPIYNHTSKMKFIPGTVVGGVYTQSGNSTVWNPSTPLVADSWTLSYYDASRKDSVQFQFLTALLRSPDKLDKTYPHNQAWAELIPVP